MATASLRLNRIILLQARVVTRDPTFGSEIEAWIDVAKEGWACYALHRFASFARRR